MAGLTEDGFVTKPYTEALSDLVTSERFLIDSDISTDDDELLGQLNQIFADTIASLWDLADSVNSNFDPDKAEKKNLDDLGSLIGISRFSDDESTGTQTVVAVDGTVLSAGTIFQNPISKDQFKTLINRVVETGNCVSAKYSVKNLQNTTEYTITVNNTDYDFTSDSDATELEILNGIEALITADLSATWAATVDSGALQISIATENSSNIAITSTTLISSDEVTIEVVLDAVETGALVVPANSVTEIVTPITLISTTNAAAFSLGRDLETDEELRLRFRLSRATSGLSTPDAIVAALLETEDVTSASVFENETLVTDGDGRPGKSFEALVEGGLDSDVGMTIWVSKPAGIETYGNTAEIVTDSSGESKTVNFSRPVDIYFAFRVTYTLYDEETFPVEGPDAIRDALVASTAALEIGEDVIVTRYFGDIYSSVPGIDTLLVEYEILASPGDIPTGTWLTAKYGIEYNEKASTVTTDITLVEN